MSSNILKVQDQEIEIGSQDWADYVLSTDPFEGDFGSGTILEDKIVKARSTKKLCHDCYSILEAGTFTRHMVIADEGKIFKSKFCQECCIEQGFGEFLYEGNVELDTDEAWEAACTWNETTKEWDEPKELWILRDERRAENVNFLEEKLGGRYFDECDQVKYDIMLSKK